MKKYFAMILSLLIALTALTACGSDTLDMEQVEGTWCISTIDGMAFEDYCEQYGADPESTQTYWTISGEAMTTETSAGSSEVNLRPEAGGFMMLDDKGGDAMGVKYDADADTLTFKVNNGEAVLEYVMARAD